MKSNSFIKITSVLALPVLVACTVVIFKWKPAINLLSDKSYQIEKFSDNENKGNSICNFNKENGYLNVSYRLKKGLVSPYAGLSFHRTDTSLFDIEDYTVNLVIESKIDMRLVLRSDQLLPGYSLVYNSSTFLLLTKSIDIKKGFNTYSINTNDINVIPDWWYSLNPLMNTGVKQFNYKQTQNIWLYSDYALLLNKPVSFRLKQLELRYNFYPLLGWSFILLITYYLILLVLWKFKFEEINYFFMRVDVDKVSEISNSSISELLAFIGKNYSNPDLNLTMVSKSLGISQDKISAMLKKYSNINFSQYVNHIRMEEAKRLLKESTIQITEIAHLVGYSNSQHFNRVFKDFTKETPKSYREINA